MSELHVVTHFDARHGWVLVPLQLAGQADLDLVLDTGTFYSVISEQTRAELDANGLLEPVGRDR